MAAYHLKTAAYGCAYCAGRYRTAEEFAELVHAEHPEIEILGDYIGLEKHILVRCGECGNEWSPVASSLKVSGCPQCAKSHGERKIRKLLDENMIAYDTQARLSGCKNKQYLRFDFIVPSRRICIEYQGEQHYRPVQFGGISKERAISAFKGAQKRDKIKREYCALHHIKLIEIPYWEYDRIEDILRLYKVII